MVSDDGEAQAVKDAWEHDYEDWQSERERLTRALRKASQERDDWKRRYAVLEEELDELRHHFGLAP